MALDKFYLVFLVSVVAEACTGGGAHDEYRVIRKTDSDGKQVVIAIGEDARLSCQTNIPWKKCLWKPPRNGVKDLRCEFDRDKVTNWICPSFPEVHFDKEASTSDSCGIVVSNIMEHHEGNWKCEFLVDIPEEEKPILIKDKIKLIARGWRYP